MKIYELSTRYQKKLSEIKPILEQLKISTETLYTLTDKELEKLDDFFQGKKQPEKTKSKQKKDKAPEKEKSVKKPASQISILNKAPRKKQKKEEDKAAPEIEKAISAKETKPKPETSKIRKPQPKRVVKVVKKVAPVVEEPEEKQLVVSPTEEIKEPDNIISAKESKLQEQVDSDSVDVSKIKDHKENIQKMKESSVSQKETDISVKKGQPSEIGKDKAAGKTSSEDEKKHRFEKKKTDVKGNKDRKKDISDSKSDKDADGKKQAQKGIKIHKHKFDETKQIHDKKKPYKTEKDKARKERGWKQKEPSEKNIRKPDKQKKVVKTHPIPKSIDITESITVADLAKKLHIKANELIQKFIALGEMATINQLLDADTASLVASEFGCEVNIISLYDEVVIEDTPDKPENITERPPVVTIMGHVDHGKTKLLDAIRKSDIVATETGGITQHIGAYVIKNNDKKIVFLDTPGHEAFAAMRARGSSITDIVVLVVAADDGVMPQTVEAINHAKAAKVPIVVAINKIDMPKANIDRVKQQLSEYDLLIEEWGGTIQAVEISAKQKINIDKLLEAIVLEAEMLDLKGDPDKPAVGRVIESRLDKGRGAVATVLIQGGTLRIGDNFVCGVFSGKVRAMFNDRGENVDEATPSIPVEVIGIEGVPEASDPFNMVENEKSAKIFSQKRHELKRMEQAKMVQTISKHNFLEVIKDGEIQELRLIVKADVQGSVEVLRDAFNKLSNDQVRVNIIHFGTGAINESDVNLAIATNAVLIGFHVRPNPKAQALAQREKVEIRKYSIIYNAIDDVKVLMEGQLAPQIEEEVTGNAEIRQTFKISKIGTIAGCYVRNGTIARSSNVRVIRDDIEIYSGKISSLKRFKEDVNEVKEGFECGISVENYNDLKVNDVLEFFIEKEIAVTLSS